jgi:integrase
LPPGPDGQRRRETDGGFASGKEAADARAEVLAQHRAGTLPKDGKLTLAQWLRTWLTTQEEIRGLRDGTMIDYRRHVEQYWIPRLGHLKLSELRARHVTNALAAIKRERDQSIERTQAANAAYAAQAEKQNVVRRARGHKRMAKPKRVPVPRPFGAATAQRVHATLRAALNAAVRTEEVSRNVAVFAETPRVMRMKVRPWEPEQLGAWLDAIADERLYALYHLGAFAGLRRGELCGLSWDDVDLDAERLVVWSQITGPSYRKARAAEKRGQPGKYLTRIKTSDGEARIVDLDTLTTDVLKLWRRKQIAERLAWGPAWSNPDNLVFTRANGRPLDPDWVYKNFIRLVRAAGHRLVPLHHLRHGSASLQLSAGVDIAVVSKRLGHSKIDLTSETYGHLIGKAGKNAAEAAAALVPRHKTA